MEFDNSDDSKDYDDKESEMSDSNDGQRLSDDAGPANQNITSEILNLVMKAREAPLKTIDDSEESSNSEGEGGGGGDDDEEDDDDEEEEDSKNDEPSSSNAGNANQSNMLNSSFEASSSMSKDDQTNDPYHYTKINGDFTSEIFKIEISNIPKFFGVKHLKNLLDKKLDVRSHKVKCVGKFPNSYAFVTFRCEADRERALSIIHGYEVKGRKLSAKRASPAADPLVLKRKDMTSEDFHILKKRKTDEGEDENIPIAEQLLNAVVPLHKIPYSKQIEQKHRSMKKFFVKLGYSAERNNLKGDWLKKQRKANENMCCPLLEIIKSPVTKGYRNKCEFNIGRHLESGEIAVGFRISSYKKGSKSVAEPVGCTNVPRSMIRVAKSFQDYINASPIKIYDPETHEGSWKQLTVRSNLKYDLMLIVVVHPDSLTVSQINEEKEKLREYYEIGMGRDYNVTSLYFQSDGQRDNPIIQHVMGREYIEEKVLGLTFRISPTSFFQINTLATELLYKQIEEFAALTPQTVVLDLCCGTGTIGLTLASKVKRVIGVELCQAAVSDARLNAEINGITNAEFICAKAEDTIYRILKTVDDNDDVVVIVDPPRAGLYKTFVRHIRGIERIKRLVYVSCDPMLAMTNFEDLMRPESKAYKGNLFLPVKAVPVDLFPHTPHCEVIILFERE